MIVDSVESLIGNTPLLRIPAEIHGLQHIELYAKLEHLNPFGSIKDRVAQGLLAPALADAKETGKTILESSSGNTAKALGALCGMHGLPFMTVTNRIRYPEVRQILQTMGTKLEELPGLSDCSDPFDPNDAIQFSRELCNKNPGKFHLTDQYYSELNAGAHYETTAREIDADLGTVDYLFGFLGTCGSTLGVGRHLREKNPDSQIFGVVSEPGTNIPGGRNFEELWEVGLFQRSFYSEILSGSADEALDGMLTLSRRCGVLCGPSTGLIFTLAIEKLRELDATLSPTTEKRRAVFFVCDRLEPYMGFIQRYRPAVFSQQESTRLRIVDLPDSAVEAAPRLSAQELPGYLAAHNPMVIDTRGHFAYSVAHIPGSINILDEVLASLVESGRVFPVDRPIVLLCRVGESSRRYAAFLAQQGYDAYSVDGGAQALKRAGFALAKLPTKCAVLEAKAA
ncbi:MAG: pyridoxal-phosphate dependent enzyme [Deltaproteobacteria bacterium]|nr:pyridoxal-phosphate dependent enzyme [Deltaproteobacteria bacterium]